MILDKKHMLLYAVTDRAWSHNTTLGEQVMKALDGGITCLQLREKDLEKESFKAEAYEIKELCNKYSVPFIINDNVELAIECGADGIHVGQEDMSALDVRNRIGESMILGVSVHNVEQAITAEQCGANYIGVGAVFSTNTKGDAKSVSYDILTEICNSVTIPVVAIGGITKENIMLLQGSGIDGVAVVSAIFSKEDIKSATKELMILSEQMLNR